MIKDCTGLLISYFFLLLVLCSQAEYLEDLESDCFGRQASDSVFEIYTGSLLTAPNSLLENLRGISSLENCISACGSKVKCRALNYETELCVLFSTSALYEPDALSSSEFPAFTIYAQKICVKSGRRLCSNRTWAFETVRGHILGGEASPLSEPSVLTREACMGRCLSMGACRSVNYNVSSGACALLANDRFSGILEGSNGVDYMESNCDSHLDLPFCKFQSLSDKILKTMDSVHHDIESRSYCESLCLKENIGCRSYDYGEAGPRICRLSHHSSETLSHLSSPYIAVLGSTTFELSACYDISVGCHDSYMMANIMTNRMFKGRIYGKGRPNSCGLNVDNKMNFSLKMDYNDIGCDVKELHPGRFVSDVVLQHHETIVTNSDISLKVKCNYDLLNRTVNNQESFNVDGRLDESAEAEQTIIHSPNVTMRITDRQRRDITMAKVGDHLALTFRIQSNDERHQYQIFVRELVAIDGLDSSEILLIDNSGCPTDISIMSFVEHVAGSAEILQANFDAFKFPTSDTVQFRAVVTPCIPRCDPVTCDAINVSYGKRRKRRDSSSSENDILVGGIIQIHDKFVADEEEEEARGENNFSRSRPDRCLDAVGAIVGGSVFLLTQMTLVAGILYLYMRRKRYSLSRNDSFLQHTARR